MESEVILKEERNSYTRKVLQLALDAGSVQLRNGAEIWRVEDTVAHICRAFSIEDVDAFILSNGIFITGNNETEAVFARVKHIPLAGVNLGIVTEVNDLSREISAGKLTVEEANARLEEIQNRPPRNAYYRGAGSFVGAACFSYILGADVMESVLAGFAGMLGFMLSLRAERYHVSKLVKNMFCGAAIALMALAFTRIPSLAEANIDRIIIGAIMPLIPGVAFVNSIRDIVNSDFLAGTVRLLDAAMVFMYIAIGASIALSLYHGLLGGAYAFYH